MTKLNETSPAIPRESSTPELADYPPDPFRSLDASIAEIEKRLGLTLRTRANLERALDTIDAAERDRFLERHADRLRAFSGSGPGKYADLAIWALRKVLVAEWLNLDNVPPLRILDIGMGSGSFSMVAQSMGHDVIGTDIADPWYAELCELQGARRIIAPVMEDQDFVVDGGPFDLVTIMLPVFHRVAVGGGKRRYWTIDKWRDFLSSVALNCLQQGGGDMFILMPLDKDETGNLSYSPVLGWAEARGAVVGRFFPSSPVNCILFRSATPADFAK